MSSGLTLKHYQAVLAVARYGSFSLAAQRLGTTQPNISNRLAAIEALVGEPLFLRSKAGVSPTKRGEALILAAQKVMSAHEQVEAILVPESQPTLKLFLGVSEIVVQTWLPDFMAALTHELPGLEVVLKVDLSVNLSRDLIDHKLDLCFQTDPTPNSDFEQIGLSRHAFCWAKAKGSKLGFAPNWPGPDPLLVTAKNTKPLTELTAFLKASGQSAKLFESSSLSAVRHLTASGMGIGLLPASMIDQDLQPERFETLKAPFTPTALICVARHSRYWASPLVRKAAGLAVDITKAYMNNQMK